MVNCVNVLLGQVFVILNITTQVVPLTIGPQPAEAVLGAKMITSVISRPQSPCLVAMVAMVAVCRASVPCLPCWPCLEDCTIVVTLYAMAGLLAVVVRCKSVS